MSDTVSDSERPLVGRDEELALLDRMLSEAADGAGRVVLIEGEAGLGKTSLLGAAADAAGAAGFVVVRARATELERDFAYGCVRQLLEPVVVRASAADRKRLLGGAAELAAPLFSPGAESAPADDAGSPFRALHGLYWLLNNLAADAPVLVAVDDLQWADADSLRFLEYLTPRLDGVRVAVHGSLRARQTDSASLARLASAPETTLLRLAPLDIDAIARLCRRELGEVSEEFVVAVGESTGGNPFFLKALLREVREQGSPTGPGGADRVRSIAPTAVVGAVLLRLSSAPPAAGALLRSVAVLGDGATVREVAELSEIGEGDVRRTADVLVALALLRPGTTLELIHPIVREAVCADLGVHGRAEAHARAAGVLADCGASEERIAAQITAAEPRGDPQRVALLQRVAAAALSRGAPSAAASALTRALAEPPPPEAIGEVLATLGAAELRLGRSSAITHLEAAIELIDVPELHATAARRLAHALTQSGRADRAVAVIASALDVIEPHDREQALVLEAELGFHADHANPETRAPAASRLQRHADLTAATPGERLVLARLAVQHARDCQSARDAATQLESVLGGWQPQDTERLEAAGLLHDVILGLFATDALELADAYVGQLLEHAAASGSIPEVAHATCWRGWIALHVGRVAQAEADARATLELLSTHDLFGARFAVGLLVRALIETESGAAADDALSAGTLGEQLPQDRASTYLLEARGLSHLAQGRQREAYEDLTEFGRRTELSGAANPLAERWRSYAATALATVGDTERAAQMVDEDLERARRWGTPRAVGIALHAGAFTQPGGPPLNQLREAADLLARSPSRLEHARALTDIGAAQRRTNQRSDARGTLHEALVLAERCGATVLAGRARDELRAAGGRLPDRAPNGASQLTASERRVAELAAAGKSNPDIAQTLFVTRKTVETHLGHVYRKLDISGRAQLPLALASDAAAG